MRWTTLLLLAALAAPASAQDTTRATRGCFRGRPANVCRWFVITEAGVNVRLTDRLAGDENTMFSWGLGFMSNRTPTTALGGLVFVAAEGELRGGLALRWRRWLSERSAVDVTAGMHLIGDAGSGRLKPSPAVSARLVAWDLVALNARYDMLFIRDGCFSRSCTTTADASSGRLYLGAETGSWLGTAGILGTGAFIVFLFITFAASSS